MNCLTNCLALYKIIFIIKKKNRIDHDSVCGYIRKVPELSAFLLCKLLWKFITVVRIIDLLKNSLAVKKVRRSPV